MAIPLVVDGNTYNYPEQGDVGYATQATAWANAVTGAVATAETNIAALQAVPVKAYAEYTTTAGQSIPNNTATIINFGTLVTDTDSAVTTGASWHFTVPTGKGGRYLISAIVTTNTTQAGAVPGTLLLEVFKNGSLLADVYRLQMANSVFGATSSASGMTIVNVVATDTLDVRFTQSSGAGAGAVALNATAAVNRITIEGPF